MFHERFLINACRALKLNIFGLIVSTAKHENKPSLYLLFKKINGILFDTYFEGTRLQKVLRKARAETQEVKSGSFGQFGIVERHEEIKSAV